MCICPSEAILSSTIFAISSGIACRETTGSVTSAKVGGRKVAPCTLVTQQVADACDDPIGEQCFCSVKT
jgi:hypothetical protein